MSKTGALLLVPVLAAAGCLRPAAPAGGGVEVIDAQLARQGAAYYSEWGCAACHGDLGGGTDAAPALVDLRGRWTIDQLAEYLRDPQAYGAAHADVRELQDRYPDVEMPAFDLPADQLRAVGAWLLSPDRQPGNRKGAAPIPGTNPPVGLPRR